ncbi:hypothetical protein [Demequina sp. NBRC 110053]|uniref:hypothetical protein n=1 Tax=Demequina sp. NBRC 110053 TaxID=1570342 RepID=UPI0013564624|nr:hypothetical protein [Demequina sp. NBRC 110053]
MADDGEPKPRTWLPLAGAGAAAVVVVGGSLVWSALGGGASPVEEAAIAACEAALDGTGSPAVQGGNVYEPPEWRDHYGVVETHGEVDTPLADLDAQRVGRYEAAAATYEEDGDGVLAVVWRLEGDTYRQCVVPVAGGEVDGSAATVGELTVAGDEQAAG